MEIAIEITGYVFLVVLGIVPIINPFSTAPSFITITGHVSPQDRRKTATMACLYMAAILLVFLFLGAMILQFFGISLQSLRMAGGLIIAYMGFRMLFPTEKAPVSNAKLEEQDPKHLAFVPLAMPMLSGPGSISVVLAMATEVSQQQILLNKAVGYFVVSVGIIVSAFICWLVLWSSGSVVKFLGKSGIDAITKLMGFLLVCIGMEFVLSAWKMA